MQYLEKAFLAALFMVIIQKNKQIDTPLYLFRYFLVFLAPCREQRSYPVVINFLLENSLVK